MTKSHRDYFNKLAPDWDSKMPSQPEFREYLIRFGVSSGERILDIGAGTGRMTRLLVDAVGPNGCVVAQDIALQMLIETRSLLQNQVASLVCEDVHALAYSDLSFNKVLCFSAFPHFPNQSAALLEMARVLKHGGRMLILHNISSNKLNAFHATLSDPVNRDRLPHSSELLQMMFQADLKPVLVEETNDLYWVEAIKP
ncbi:class I SAM-dependent methyltransferase [candidate division KSB1 bacterium]|nr:class I SAM-dependent methyltransferase [candidate division KSB1 bacterium]